MPLIARQRSRLAVLAVLALVGSLLAVSAVPAVAAGDKEPSQTADYSACVAAATEDAGFTDTAGNFAEDAINCLAHYMITTGTSEGVFSPNDSISRAQMALFMVRAAGVAGAELDDPEDEGLGDIGNWTDTIQDAINQAVGAGIMSGHNDMFNPTASVSRQSMAVILDAFIEVVNGDDYYDVAEDKRDTPFSDLGQVPFASYNAINRIYELGIASGTGDGSTFGPDDLVSRAQMARFVTAALGHTNARPTGISVQSKPDASTVTGMVHDLVASVRDDNHQPVLDALVDVFSSTNPDEVLDDEGACDDDELANALEDCTIDDGDQPTESNGNANVQVTLPTEPGTLTVWVWTGDVDDEFDGDETMAASIEIEAKLAGVATTVSDDLKKGATRLEFGDTVTYTIQVVDTNGDPVEAEGLGVQVTATVDDTTSAEGQTDGALRNVMETTQVTYKTDAAGRVTFDFTEPDPDDDEDSNDRVTLSVTIAAAADNPVPLDSSAFTIKATDIDGTDGFPIQIMWSDEAALPTTLTLDQAINYHETDSDGVRNTVTATLVDQFGNPVKDAKVAFWSDVTNTADMDLGLGGSTLDSPGSATNPALPLRTTSPRGTVSKSYQRDVVAAATEMLDAQVLHVIGCTDTETDCTETNDLTIEATAVSHYWAESAEDETISGAVLVADKDNNTIVVNDQGSTPTVVSYKSGDVFYVGAVADVSLPSSMEEFEKALNAAGDGVDADTVSVTVGDDPDDTNSFRITVNNS